jgi:hypothetical protein
MKATNQTQRDMSPLNDSEKSPSYSEESCSINNTLTSFLHRLILILNVLYIKIN